MQMSFIFTLAYQKESSTVEARKDETPLCANRQLQSGPIHRLGTSERSEARKCYRAMSSSALSTTSANLLEDGSSSPPSFRYYLQKDSKPDLNKESQRYEKQVRVPQTDAKHNKLNQLIDTSKTLIPCQEPRTRTNKKKKKHKFKFLTRKDKGFKDKAPLQEKVQAIQEQVPVIPPRVSQEHEAAVVLQKIIRGFLLRKDLKILRNIDMIAEEFGKNLVKYEEDLKSGKKVEFRDDDNIIIMNLQHQLGNLGSVRGAMVYKRKVREKVAFLQERVDNIDAQAYKHDLNTMIDKSDIVVDSDELRGESFHFSKMQHHKVVEAWSSTEQAASGNSSTKMRHNDYIMDNYVSDLVVENESNSTIEENQAMETLNLLKEYDEQEAEGDGESTIMKIVDPSEGQKESNIIVELDKLTKKPLNLDRKDEISLTEETSAKYAGVTEEETEIKEMVKTINSYTNVTEQELNLNDPIMETMNEVYDPIKCQKLLNMFQKFKQLTEFSDNALEICQLETCYNKPEEKEVKGLKEIMEGLKELSMENKEMKTLMKGLENRVEDLGKSVLRIESREKINVQNFGRRCNSFS